MTIELSTEELNEIDSVLGPSYDDMSRALAAKITKALNESILHDLTPMDTPDMLCAPSGHNETSG